MSEQIIKCANGKRFRWFRFWNSLSEDEKQQVRAKACREHETLSYVARVWFGDWIDRAQANWQQEV